MTSRHRFDFWPSGSLLSHALLALLAYVPILRTEPGVIAADTKSYLYLDPARLLARAISMWDPNVGMGTLTHQTIGYLFPMGPWYWLLERLGFPDWVAQRLWLGTVLFAAGAGVLFLARTIAPADDEAAATSARLGVLVAALAYMLSPYVLDYSARISVILLPWAALPWLIGLADRALRRGGWRHASLFALVVLAVGGVNATALVFAGLGPVLWIAFARAPLGRTVATVLKIGLLTSLVSVWWVMGLAVQGAYGIPILRYTETVETVARTSLASEVLRGLGYWFFYGNDKLGPWIEPAIDYTQSVWLIGVGFALPVLAFLGAAVLRWRHRAYAVVLIVTGTVIAVGAHPYDEPSPLGGAFKALASTSTVGLALRSTPRAVPLVALGVALLLGATITALGRRLPVAGTGAALACAVLILAGMPPLFTGSLAVGEQIKRPERIPSYWIEAADHLDERGKDTRVLELPGADFASYRWGNTIDPITPYLMNRPYVARELIPYGTPGTPDLLNALDRRLQEGVSEPEALAPIARLMHAGDLAVRNDVRFERYRTPRPRSLAALLRAAAGLGEPTGFGPPTAAQPDGPVAVVDEHELGVPADVPDPPAVMTVPVNGVRPIVSTAPAGGGLLVAGDGEGLVDLAAAGLLPTDGTPVRYAGTLTTDEQWDEALSTSGPLVLTDTNRKRARRWGTVRENTGYTEPAVEEPLRDDPTDARLELFPHQTADDQTVAEQRGVRSIRATRYGNPVSYTPEDRAANALDGDLATAWRVGAFADVQGDRLRVDLDDAVQSSAINVVQPQTGPRNRSITRARLRFDGSDRDRVDVDLGPASLTPEGQTITFPSRRFRTVEVEIRDTSTGRRPKYDGLSGVGIAELRIDGTDARVDEVLRLPTSLLERAGARAAAHPLSVVLTRARSDPADPARADEEPAMKRTFALPDERPFTLAGTARFAAGQPDDAIDRTLAGEQAAAAPAPVPTASSDARLPGSLHARAAAAFDGDPTTAWSPGLLDQVGHWVEVTVPDFITVDHLDLQVVADGVHSVPTRIRFEADGGADTRFFDLPAITDGNERGAITVVPLDFTAMTGRTFRLAIEDVRPVTTPDFFSGAPLDLPVAIAEVGIPGVVVPAPPSTFIGACRDDLVTIDGRPFPVRVTGTSADAIARRGLAIEPCGVSAGLDLGAGEHEVRTTPGRDTGVDIDRLVLRSEATSPDPASALSVGAPRSRVVPVGRTGFDVRIDPADGPFWLVLGQSRSDGWHATIGDRDLGPPDLVDGYANGWRLDADDVPAVVRLRWTPQQAVDRGLVVSAVAILLCLAVVAASFTRFGRARGRHAAPIATRSGGRATLGLPNALQALAPVVVLVVFGVAAGPPVGVAAAVIVAIGAFVRRLRWLPGLAAALALAAAGGYTALQQSRYAYPPDFAWPANFPLAHHLGWLAVALLAGSALQKRTKTRESR